MLTVLTTTEHQKDIQKAIDSVERLDELVSITVNAEDASAKDKLLSVISETIQIPIDWHDTGPPYLFPSVEFSEKTFLATIFYKLGNHQKVFEYVSEDDVLYNHLIIATHLQFGYTISEEMLQFLKKNSKHNFAITNHYGQVEKPLSFEELSKVYREAIKASDNDEYKLFSAKHYLNLLLDFNKLDEAKAVIEQLEPKAISEEAKNALKVHLSTVLLAELSLPYSDKKLQELLSLQLESIRFYEERHLTANAGLLMIDASEVANFKNDFIQSKELINKAIQYFKDEDLREFLGEAGLKKATLLYNWSKNGSPQYYKASINAFQDVLKIYKRESHPQKFADIHHNLALIYSEIPVSTEEKAIWTAFCASSFKEVLAFYNKDDYPYEYAMANHNYATALMDFPPAKIHDNLEKASGLFEEALDIRTAKDYPFERALTLLNQLELFWLKHNEDETQEAKRFSKMLEKSKEVKELVADENLIQRANENLERLEKLKALI